MVSISLTPAGRKFINQRLPERYEKFHRVMSSLSSRERTTLLQTYAKIIDLIASGMEANRK
jgi:DNA-binding MarR family transcriptional regulator